MYASAIIYRHGDPFENSFSRLNSDSLSRGTSVGHDRGCRLQSHVSLFCVSRSKRSKRSKMVIKVFNLYKVFKVVTV